MITFDNLIMKIGIALLVTHDFFLNTMRDIVFQRQTMAKWLNLEILA